MINQKKKNRTRQGPSSVSCYCGLLPTAQSVCVPWSFYVRSSESRPTPKLGTRPVEVFDTVARFFSIFALIIELIHDIDY
jgi:hypothetical protein